MKHEGVIRRVLVTEKSTKLSYENRYMLEVAREANKMEIRQAVEELPQIVDRRMRIVETIRTCVEESKSVSPAAEMADQINEINNEIWYRGEEGITDRARISEEWTRRYAAQWRNARLQELLFLVQAMADELVALVED